MKIVKISAENFENNEAVKNLINRAESDTEEFEKIEVMLILLR